jgi:hypothetical protein
MGFDRRRMSCIIGRPCPRGDAAMPKSIFISLPVTDVSRSTAFYEAIGF